ncbi:hypothetical protein TWF481_004369 [Arthrobotrys musiformis]|uniref:Uncharacterized protein n=1 Tax=Arthrobotrys musiformis TaxID=47236 RepID=A0AAV9WJD6_9PEZI
MRAYSSSWSRLVLLFSWALLNGISNVHARRITVKQVQKAPPDDMLLEQDYAVTENDRTVSTSIQRWTDASPEWMDDGCTNLEESGDNWLLEEITYNPARANPSHPYFLGALLIFNRHFCNGIPLFLHLGDFTDDGESETDIAEPGLRPWEDPRNGELEEGYQIVAGRLNPSVPFNFELEIPDNLPSKDIPEDIRSPKREDFTDIDEFDREAATRWHKASAWRGKQHIEDIAAGMLVEANEVQGYGHEWYGDLEEIPDAFGGDDISGQNENEWFDRVAVFRRDLSLYGYWGAVSIKFVTDYSRWYTTNLQREVL